MYSNWPSLGQHLIYSFRLWAAPWALWVIWHLYFALSSSSLRWWECNCSERTIMVSAKVKCSFLVPFRSVRFRFVSFLSMCIYLLFSFCYRYQNFNTVFCRQVCPFLKGLKCVCIYNLILLLISFSIRCMYLSMLWLSIVTITMGHLLFRN